MLLVRLAFLGRDGPTLNLLCRNLDGGALLLGQCLALCVNFFYRIHLRQFLVTRLQLLLLVKILAVKLPDLL